MFANINLTLKFNIMKKTKFTIVLVLLLSGLINFLILGQIENHGIISSSNYNFTIEVHGDIYNWGTFSNFKTILCGSFNKYLYQYNSSVFEFQQCVVEPDSVFAKTNLRFNNTQLDFNNKNLTICEGKSVTITGSSSYLSGANIWGNNSVLDMGAGTYITNCNIDDVAINGLVSVKSNVVFTTSLVVYGALYNFPDNHYTCSVLGDIYNYGTISSNNTNLILDVEGNIGNSGTWSINSLNLTGNEVQQLSCDPASSFDNTVINVNKTGGYIDALTGLNFDHCNINVNNDTIFIASGEEINMQGGYITEAVIIPHTAKAAFEMDMSSGAVISASDVHNVTLQGTTVCGNTTFTGDIYNNGTLLNYSTNHYTVYIAGNLHNTGNISNNNTNLVMNISGNVVNDGTWTNNSVYLNGGTSQEISCLNGHVFECGLICVSGTGPVIALTGLSFSNCNIDFQNNELQMPAGSIFSLSG
ncbi:MAG: hypothetical protein B6D61_11070, partial [Bacteroidetes bacterium 4484_249]